MVKVKMDYNPYLMETKVKFNNKEPRINSLIEKYYQYPIQMWVEHIPRILYDEMNGYDFDLEFSGTELDYNELVSAFNDAGITSDEVRCIHERIMEGRVDKLREINELKTLDALLTKGMLNEQEKIRIVLNVFDALSFLHSAKIPIIHRDIKPSNIMITNDGIVKLIDYDAAKVFHRGKNEDTTLIGTVGRAAPEQFGFAQSDARTDVYSMGMMLKDMFPNDGRFTRIIAKATAMNPPDRYQTMAQLKAAVESAVSKQGKRRIGQVFS